MEPRPAPYEHYRTTDGVAAPGVYRVVGVDEDDGATLLRVADEDGRRVHTGTVAVVPRDQLDEAFVRAENPDSGSRLPRVLSGVGIGFLAVALLSWAGILTTPATAGTLATIGLLLALAGRVVDRYHFTDLPGLDR